MKKDELMGMLEEAMKADMEYQKELLVSGEEITEDDWKLYQMNSYSNKAGFEFVKFIFEMDAKLDKILEKLAE